MWYFANNQNIKVVIMELYRNIIEELKTWKRNPGEKPLILKRGSSNWQDMDS